MTEKKNINQEIRIVNDGYERKGGVNNPPKTSPPPPPKGQGPSSSKK